MSNLLISLGHGKNKKGGYDPGAKGNGTNEAEFLRGSFLTSLKKYAGNKIDFYEQDMYVNNEANTISGHKEVIELHLDWSSLQTKGGHVIIAKGFSPDALDKRLGETIKRNFGLRGNTMFDNRDNLLNLNVFKRRGISYRLLELCFITNKENMDYFKANYDKVAKELVQDILNTTIVSKPAQEKVNTNNPFNVKSTDTVMLNQTRALYWADRGSKAKEPFSKNDFHKYWRIKSLEEKTGVANIYSSRDGKDGGWAVLHDLIPTNLDNPNNVVLTDTVYLNGRAKYWADKGAKAKQDFTATDKKKTWKIKSIQTDSTANIYNVENEKDGGWAVLHDLSYK